MKTHAFPLQLAKEAILLGRYSEALPLLQPLSAAGNLDAQFLHAYLHFWDDNLHQAEAVVLMQKVADADHAEANYILAVCPDLSPGYSFTLPTDKTLFARLSRAAELGLDTALTDLAECYLHGRHVKKAAVKARHLLTTAFDQSWHYRHLSKTCFLLGRMQLFGIGGDTDFDQGIRKLVYSVKELDNSHAVEAIELIRSQTAHRTETVFAELLSELEEHHAQRITKASPVWQAFLRYHCASTLHYDLRGISMDACMDFIFDHCLRSWRDEDYFRLAWDRLAKVIFVPSELLRLYTQMFHHADLLGERYSVDQIKQGFGMDGIRGWADWTIGCLVVNASSPVEVVEACIHAIVDIFVKLFSKPGFTDISYMWWDIGYGACGHGWRGDPTVNKREWSEEVSQRFAQASFDTMVRVLNLESFECQEAAVHGLGHSKHPDKEKVLRQYLEEHPDLSVYMQDYVKRAIEGRIA